MVTKLGKFLRILRIKNGESAKEMSNKLDISPSYLSAIELGKREMTDKIADCVERNYKLSKEEVEEFRGLVSAEQKYLKIDTRTSNEKTLSIMREMGSKKEIAPRKLSLIQNILNDDIGEGTINQLLEILSNNEEK